MRFFMGTALKFRRITSKSNFGRSFSSSLPLEDYTIIKEGEAEILMDPNSTVFYNKVQVHNRDMSIAVLRTFISKYKEEHGGIKGKVRDSNSTTIGDKESRHAFDGYCDAQLECHPDISEVLPKEPLETVSSITSDVKDIRVLEALAASGLRSLRYAREVEGISKVICVDNDKKSIKACNRNIQFNGSVVSSKVEAHLDDARVYMLTHPKELDVVDLDPYGSPSIFLDSAVQSVSDGGLLMCTATDMGVLCGGNMSVCYSKYGSYPLQASAVKMTPQKLSYVYQCVGCDSFHLQSLGRTSNESGSTNYAPGFGPAVTQHCTNCEMQFNMGGPIWSAPIHDMEWVASILDDVKATKDKYPAYKKISSVLTAISQELPDVPLFLSIHNLSATIKCSSPSLIQMQTAVTNAGYRSSGSHVNPLALKTDAPMNIIWDIMRCWAKSQHVEPQPTNKSGMAILSREPELLANFSCTTESQNKARRKEARFHPNPEKYWGPKARARWQLEEERTSHLGEGLLSTVPVKSWIK